MTNYEVVVAEKFEEVMNSQIEEYGSEEEWLEELADVQDTFHGEVTELVLETLDVESDSELETEIVNFCFEFIESKLDKICEGCY